MDLSQLRYFLSVAEWGSFTVAAKKCNVSQPALSQQIAKLEKEFGASLFDRQGRHVTLTRIGFTLKNRASQIMHLVDDTMKQMLDDGRFGSLVFATAKSIGPYLSAKLLQHLTREFAEADLAVVEKSVSEIVRDCGKGELDLAIVPYPCELPKDIVCEPVFVEEIKVGVSRSHPLAEQAIIQPEQLAGEKVVWVNDQNGLPETILGTLESLGVSMKSTANVECYVLLNYLVSLDQGVAFFPSSTIPRQCSKNVSFISIAGRPLCRTLAVCWNQRRYQTQLMSNFVKSIREFSFADLRAIERPLDEKPGTPNLVAELPNAISAN